MSCCFPEILQRSGLIWKQPFQRTELDTAAKVSARCWSAKTAKDNFKTCMWQNGQKMLNEATVKVLCELRRANWDGGQPVGCWSGEVEALLFAPLDTGPFRMKFCLQAIYWAEKYRVFSSKIPQDSCLALRSWWKARHSEMSVCDHVHLSIHPAAAFTVGTLCFISDQAESAQLAANCCPKASDLRNSPSPTFLSFPLLGTTEQTSIVALTERPDATNICFFCSVTLLIWRVRVRVRITLLSLSAIFIQICADERPL